MRLNISADFPVSFDSMVDEQIIDSIRSGNNIALEFLIHKYKTFVRSKAKTYFLIGGDREDIFQEGMIGLYKAIRDFKDNKLSSFKSFADLCVTRQIITAVKTSTRQKHIPLNSYISLNKPIYEDESDKTLMDTIQEEKINHNPEEMAINKENTNGIEFKLNNVLSNFELEVLSLYLQGDSYQEIAKTIKKSTKSIDNALQRIKRKLEKN